MSLESFGADLRKQRELKQLTLEQISEATRINVKFLHALEEGKFSLLPQTYIRAFIRAYARAVDLDPEAVIQKYDEANRELHAAAEQWITRGKQEVVPPSEKLSPKDIEPSRFSQREMALFAGVALVLVIIVYMTLSVQPVDEKPVAEIAFDKVVRESEAAVVKPETVLARPVSELKATGDSLRLEIATLDSVWMTIVIDNVRRGEYLFPPNRKRTWIGKEQFMVSMGNAGNAMFKLNGKDLGALGRKGTIVRDILITEDGVRRSN